MAWLPRHCKVGASNPGVRSIHSLVGDAMKCTAYNHDELAATKEGCWHCRRTDKSVLDLAMDIAFVNCKQDVLREHQKALEAIKTRLDELQRELELIQKVETHANTQ